MKVLLDTNVVLDLLLQREPFCDDALKVFRLCEAGKVVACITINQTTDIFYLLCRSGKPAPLAKKIVAALVNNLKTLDVNQKDGLEALGSDMFDYEDALIAFCAKRHRVSYVITRNEKDFKLSPIKALSPIEFVSRHKFL